MKLIFNNISKNKHSKNRLNKQNNKMIKYFIQLILINLNKVYNQMNKQMTLMQNKSKFKIKMFLKINNNKLIKLIKI